MRCIKNHAVQVVFSSQPLVKPSALLRNHICLCHSYHRGCCWCLFHNTSTIWYIHTSQPQPQLLWMLAKNNSQLISSPEKESPTPGFPLQTSLIAGNKEKAREYKRPALFTQRGTNSVLQTLWYNRCARVFLRDEWSQSPAKTAFLLSFLPT